MFYFFPVQSFWQLCKAFGEVLNHFFLLNINFEVHFSFMRSADLRSFQLIHFYAEVSLFACSFARIHLFLSGKNIFWGKDWAWVRLQELKVLNLFFFLCFVWVSSHYTKNMKRGKTSSSKVCRLSMTSSDITVAKQPLSLIEREKIRKVVQYRE